MSEIEPDMNERYIVYDNNGNFATAYNLALGKALALNWAKLACNELSGKVTLSNRDNTPSEKVIYQSRSK
jgi:hypothetical protein